MVKKGEKELAHCWERIQQAHTDNSVAIQSGEGEQKKKNAFRSQQVCAHVWQNQNKVVETKESWRESAGNIVKSLNGQSEMKKKTHRTFTLMIATDIDDVHVYKLKHT